MSLNLAELHTIVRSLGKSQKRSFTMYFSQYKSDSNALALFKAISELKEYDRELLVEQLQKMGKHNIAEKIIGEATNLYRMILKKFMFMESEKSIVKRLKNTFDEIVFLEGRGLFAKSQRMLKKLVNDTIEYDLKAFLLEIYTYERRMIIGECKDSEIIPDINNKIKDLRKALDLEEDLKGIYNDALYLAKSINTLSKNDRNRQLTEIETALSKINQEEVNSFNTKRYYLILL